MPAYAIARLHEVEMGPAITQYLQRIDSTLAPFSGAFRIHGARPQVLEGEWGGDLIVIEFPHITQARAWYASPAYREIMPLRTGHSRGDVILIEGVPEGHKSTDLLAAGG